MKQVYETAPIRSILEQADTLVKIDDLLTVDTLGYCALVVETVDDAKRVEGTLIYFPGVNAKTLLKR